MELVQNLEEVIRSLEVFSDLAQQVLDVLRHLPVVLFGQVRDIRLFDISGLQAFHGVVHVVEPHPAQGVNVDHVAAVGPLDIIEPQQDPHAEERLIPQGIVLVVIPGGHADGQGIALTDVFLYIGTNDVIDKNPVFDSWKNDSLRNGNHWRSHHHIIHSFASL